MNELILITSSFPLYADEPFLEKEYAYLKEKFDKIDFIVITSNASNHLNASQFESHDVLEICPTGSGKLKMLIYSVFRANLWRETGYILSKIKLRYFFSSLKVAMVSLENAKNIKRVLDDKLSKSQSTKTVIYSYWGDDGAIAASQMADHPKVNKVVTRVHGWDVYFNLHSPPYLPFRSLIQKKCSGIFPISAKGKSTIRDVWKVSDANVFTSRLGVDRQPSREGKGDGIFTLVSCSNLIPLKRVQLIAESVLAVTDNIKWVHFGDGQERKKIAEFIEKNKKENHEIVFLGKVENSVVIDFYRNQRVDLFINASTTEGIPFSIMEAISFGIPVLASDVGGNSEIVDEENGALLSENPTKEEIAEQIERFMEMDQDEFGRFSTGAFSKWENEYNAEKNFGEFAQLISE